MKQLRTLLRELFDILNHLKSPLIDIFQPGIRLDSKMLIDKYDLKFFQEIYELYEWRNGINEEQSESKQLGQLYLFNLGIFDSFDIALNTYTYYTQNQYWGKGFFPLFSSGGGDFFLIDTIEGSKTYKKLYYYSPGDPDFNGMITIFDSLESLFISTLKCFSLGGYKYNSNNHLVVNYEIEANIFSNYNPESDYWKLERI